MSIIFFHVFLFGEWGIVVRAAAASIYGSFFTKKAKKNEIDAFF